jgi:hypothetical protein
MQQTHWPIEAVDIGGGPATRWTDLRQAAHGELPLSEAFHTLAHYSEEQASTATDLLTREAWALSMILDASAPVWRHIPMPTLRLVQEDGSARPAAYHLEVGHFAHLAGLMAPTEGEQTLIAATTPCWAKVYPHHIRREAGYTGALARSYVPISVAEAVSILGFAKIMAQIDAAARAAGQALLAEAQAQQERHERLLLTERMLGWEPPPMTSETPALPTMTRLALLLLGRGEHVWLAAGTALVGIAIAVVLFVAGVV